MSARLRIGRVSKAALLIAAGAAGGAAAIAVASVPGAGGVIEACVAVTTTTGGTTVPLTDFNGPNPVGNVQIIDTGAGQTCTEPPGGPAPLTETTLTWGQTGPQGVSGPAGPPGIGGAGTIDLVNTIGSIGTLGGAGTIDLVNTVSTAGTIDLSPSSPGKATIAVGSVGTIDYELAPPSIPAGAPSLGAASMQGHTSSFAFRVSGYALLGPTVTAHPGSGSTKASAQLLRITKLLDNTSPKLLLSAHAGSIFKSATIVVNFAGGHNKYLEIDLTNAVVVAVQDQAGTGALRPSEVLTLRFQKISFAFKNGNITSTGPWQNS